MEPNGSAKSGPKNGTKSDQSDQKSCGRILPPFRLTGQCECAVAYPQPTLGQIKNLSPIFGQLPSAAGGVRVIMGEGGAVSSYHSPPPPHSAGGEAGVSRCTRLGQPHKCNQIKLQSQNPRPTNQSFLSVHLW